LATANSARRHRRPEVWLWGCGAIIPFPVVYQDAALVHKSEKAAVSECLGLELAADRDGFRPANLRHQIQDVASDQRLTFL